MDSRYFHKISEQLHFTLRQVNNIFQLQKEGSSIPFISRYRKEATGNMDEVQVNNVIEQIAYFEELDKRKETVLKTIEALGKLTPELKRRIQESFDATELEDIYLPYKPKRKTRAFAAIEKGMEPLARLMYEQQPVIPQDAAVPYLSEEVKDIEEALQGARDIIAEWISENEQARVKMRELFDHSAVLHSRVVKSKKDDQEAQKYRDYFEYKEPLNQCPSHRVLAIRRGEKEGLLLMDINIDMSLAFDELSKMIIRASNGTTPEINKALEDCIERLLKPSIETEFRVMSKTKADEDAIKVFAENLRQLLLSPPLGSKRVLALDPGFRTGCKLVCLDEQGNLLYNTTIYPHAPQHQSKEAIEVVRSLVDKHRIEAIGIGNGTAGRETEQMVRSIHFEKPVSVFLVNENGASIYSASDVAREEFPDQDVTVRGAVSIGRRLLDPLSELVKIDAKSIGVGQYQHDVNQSRLKESLDKIVESCVNYVGVDLNTSSRHLLMYVSGLSTALAKNIVDYRAKNGAFTSRSELKKVSLMGPKSFEQCAGFLRIPHSKNILDNSAVHPESYYIVEEMAKDLSCTPADLIRQEALRRQINKKKYISERAGEFTINDIMKELEKPGRDPRAGVEEFSFEPSVTSITDLKPGMVLPGIITNITNFGAFVDVGVKQDGLVHISQLSNSFVADPNQVVKLHQTVTVTVTEVDVARKRIGLSMKDALTKEGKNNEDAIQRTAKPKTVVPDNPLRKDAGPANTFHAKLDELKKRFS